ncbi:MAG: IPT/TIG domain-containing protein, partial [Actinomycetota bacterium]
NANNWVYALAVSGNGSTVYAGGVFTSIGGQARNRIAALDASTGAATAWNPNANGPVIALAVSGDSSTVYAAGWFQTIGGQARNTIAALDASTGAATAWNANANEVVYDLAVSGTTVYAGGHFTSIGGQARNYIAALDASTGAATAWDPNASGPVKSLALSVTTVYAGGGFASIGGQSRNNIAALDASTGAATAWNPNANTVVEVLEVSGSNVYAGGGFASIGGQARNRIAALDASTGAATAWDPNANGYVEDLSAYGSTVYAGGQFTSIGGDSQPYLARFDTPAPTVTSITPNSGSRGGTISITNLAGTGFCSGASVHLAYSGESDIVASSVNVVSSTKITCTLDIPSGAKLDNWDVVVTNDDGQSGTLPSGFEVQYPAPTPTSITPSSGNNNGPVNITNLAGTGFRNGASVKLARGGESDINATGVSVVSPTQITCSLDLTGAEPANRDVVVTNDDAKSGTLAGGFEVQYPAPAVTSVSPNLGINNCPVYVSNLAGTDFRSGASVKLSKSGQSDIDAVGVDVVSSTRIACTFDLTGAATGLWDLTVTNPDSKSSTLPACFDVQYPAPTVSSITPSSGINSGPVSITNLSGTNFRSGAAVKLSRGGQSDINATGVTVVSPAKITCTFDLTGAQTGAWTVTVTNTDAKSGSLTDAFTVQYPSPTVTSITPSSGNNNGPVNITNLAGTGFRNGATVKLARGGESDINATGVTVVSPTQITCSFDLTGAEPANRDVVVTNDDAKSGMLAGGFEVRNARIVSVSPTSGVQGQTMNVSIVGADTTFQNTVSVASFGAGITVNSTTVSDTTHATANITIAPGAGTGTRDVNVVTGSETPDPLTGGFEVQYPAPTVTSITPSSGNNNGPVNITNLAGTGFRNGATVKLARGGESDINATGVTVVSPTQITCSFDLTGAEPANRDVVVTNDDAKSGMLAGGFEVTQSAPSITSISPTSGTVGTQVTINGSAFGATRGTSYVNFGTVQASDYVSWGNSQVKVRVPSGASGTVQVKVITPGGTSNGKSFNVTPSISSISPQYGTAGQQVTITGDGYGYSQGASYVKCGGRKITSCSSWSADRVCFRTPEGLSGQAGVTVTTAVGTSNARTFTYSYPTWYLAEGTTSWGFSTYISIENPNESAVHAAITYMTDTGQVDGGDHTLPAMSQTTVNPADTLGARDFSTLVVCAEGMTIAVDRTMVWTGTGAASEEGHCSVGVTSPAKTWYLPEGSSDWGFETWLLIQNPGGTEATCTVTYMIEGEGPVDKVKTVPANSRASFSMETDIGRKDASIKVVSNVPVIPERAMYRNNRREGHDSIGTTAGAPDYFLAEGTTGWGFTTYVLVQNPNSTPTDVDITFMTTNGPVAYPTFQMPASSRKTIRVNDVEGMANQDFSTQVSGSGDIIAERAMYWDNGTGEACHDSIGMSEPRTTFYLPDGQTSNGRETWTLVQNPNTSDVQVEISYLSPTGGGNVVSTETIGANSRKSFGMADRLPDGRAAITVTSKTAGKKIMVERAMYWNNRGAGTVTIGGYGD